MNKVEIIQQIVELRRDLLDLQRGRVVDHPRTHMDGRDMSDREQEANAQGIESAYASARMKVEGMLRRIAKSETN